jgi:hypothetical protein
MTDRILAAIARRAQRIAAGVDVAAEDRDVRKRLVDSHRMGDMPNEKAGRRRERNGRFVPFNRDP